MLRVGLWRWVTVEFAMTYMAVWMSEVSDESTMLHRVTWLCDAVMFGPEFLHHLLSCLVQSFFTIMFFYFTSHHGKQLSVI